MLPLVLGGIALAAVGYGVKEFCESEGCPWDEEEVFVRKDDFETLYEKKKEVYAKCYLPLVKYVDELQGKENLIPEEPEFIHKEVSGRSMHTEVSHYIKSYSHLLDTFAQMLKDTEASLRNLEEHEKKAETVKQAKKLLKKSKRLLALALLDEHEEVSLKSIAMIRKYKKFVEEV